MTDSKPPSGSEEQQDEKWYDRTRYQILLFAVGIALFGLVLGLILDLYIDPQTSTQKKDLVQALGLITAGVAGAVGIYFTWRGQERNQRNAQEQFRLTRQSQEQNQQSTQAQLANAQEELQLTRQGQITERFTRAIDQLGSEKLEIRLGGIYALERIDKESPERAYHGTVMEVLTAYVRENSRREPERPSTPKEDFDQATEPTLPELPIDIRAISDILQRRDEESVPEKHRVRLDLQEANLWGSNLDSANFDSANLQEANFQEAHLQKADLQGVNLQGANLQEANFQEAHLQGAKLQGANLWEAKLQGAKLQKANLQEAILWGAKLQGAKLQGAKLQGVNLQKANFDSANLQKADLQGVNLQEANLWGANLQEANLWGAKLQGANFQRADLQGADLRGANFQGANLQEANLQEAILWGSNLQEARELTQDQIECAIGSIETKLPEDLNRPELWTMSVEEQLSWVSRTRIVGGALGD